jgi:hypothetical protein
LESQGAQFRLRTLFIGMTIIAAYLGFMVRGSDSTGKIVVLFLTGPLLVLIPSLVNRATEPKLDKRDFGPGATIWMAVVSVYSIAMVFLSSIAFEASYKTEKGPEWYYYLHDMEAGFLSLPLYAAGAIATSLALANTDFARKSLVSLLLIATSSIVAFWYVFAVVFMNFARGSESIAILPFSAALIHLSVAIIVARNFQWSAHKIQTRLIEISLGWLTPLLLTLYLKVYYAQIIFARLPVSSHDCFVVTAACGGHQRFVGRRIDDETQLPVNDQLKTLRAFEEWLRRSAPRVHFYLRRFYNVVGPIVARQIRWAWQADCVYVLLKPLEWTVRALRLRG